MADQAQIDAHRRLAEQFGRNLVRARKRADLSQEEVGIRASLHRTEIGMLERGIRLPRLDTLVKLAGAIEVDPTDLLDGIEWEPAIPKTGGYLVAPDPDDEPDSETAR
jgi:transcriptional regulator with XRE-family HTH domain